MQGKVQPKAFNDESFLLTSEPANFYRLPLPLDRIFLIDNARSLRECMQVLCAVRFFPCKKIFSSHNASLGLFLIGLLAALNGMLPSLRTHSMFGAKQNLHLRSKNCF